MARLYYRERLEKHRLKPGEIADVSGQYQLIGPKGERGTERTVVKGEPLPPPPKEGWVYVLVDKTKL